MSVIETALDAETVASLRDLAEGDPAFLTDLFALYLDQADESLANLRAALKRNDRIEFATMAHRLSGSSLNVGAFCVSSACRAIENAMDAEDAEPDATQLRVVEDELQRVIAEIAIA